MIKDKKILFTSHTANFSKFNRPLMRMLKEQGNEVHYASAGEEEVLDCDKHFTIPFARSPLKLDNLKAIRQLRSLIEKEKYDLIHTHTPMGSVVTRLAARGARKNYGTKLIYTAHGFHFFKGAPLLNWAIYYPIEKSLARYTDTLITINSEDFSRAKRNFTTQVEYITGVGVDIERFQSVSATKKKQLRKEYGFAADDFILIYIAELNGNKNQAFLIKQMEVLKAKIPSIKLIFCGIGSSEATYKKLVNTLDLNDEIKFLGYRKDVDCLLALSDIAVSSSKREGLGVNLIEAMAVGLPLVASHNRGHRDLITSELNGYLFISGEDFIEFVVRLYRDKERVKKIRKHNLSTVSKYSVPASVTTMQNIYEEVMS